MNNEVLRSEPRTNMHVNAYWMCDTGRLAVPGLVNDNRLSGPKLRQNGMLVDASWDDAINAAAAALKGLKGNEIAVVGSASASNEDSYLLGKLAHDVLKTGNVDFIKHNDHTFGDNVLRLNDRSPNAIGAHSVGIAPKNGGHSVDALAERINHGQIKALIVMGDDLGAHSEALAHAAAKVDTLIVIASHNSTTAQQANVLLPMAAWAETDGTFTNTTHRVQKFDAAVVTKDNMRSMGMKMSRWDKFGAPNDRWSQGEKRDSRQGWRIAMQIANALGAGWTFTSTSSVFDHIASHVDAFKGMSYEVLKAYHGLVLGKGTTPDPVGVVYESHVMKPQ
jgi:predicted molibdopterin-dependent oxidoreductase YjgC